MSEALDRLKQETQRHYERKSHPAPREEPKVEHHSKPKAHSSELSLVSFLTGLLGFIFFPFSALAIIFGIAGLMQAKREKLKGRWMAITGIILGVLQILLLLFIIFAAIAAVQSLMAQYNVDALIGQYV